MVVIGHEMFDVLNTGNVDGWAGSVANEEGGITQVLGA
jgi:hypothetical protein